MKTKKILFYLLAGILAGCVPVMSLHPLYNTKDVVFEEKLLGTWVDDANETTWEFKHFVKGSKDLLEPDVPEKAYKLIYTFTNDEKGKGSFFAHLLKLENILFLDISPGKLPCQPSDINNCEWGFNSAFFQPVHTFIKVDSIEPQLRMRLTDDDDMEKLLKEDPNAVKHEFVDDRLILTASTKELQAFVLKYADDSRVFSNEIVLTRKETKSSDESKMTDPNATGQNKK